MKKLAALLAALPLAGCIGVADAGALVDLSIIDRSTGQQLQFRRHHGRLYVVGTPGNRYAVRLRNKSAGRVLTVVSVDGVNALNGQTAATAQSGYVLSAWQSAEIAGWRKSMDEVAAFYFTSVADSYAGRSDRPQNVGVIGIAVYREALPPPVPSAAVESPSRDSANADERQPARPAAKAAAPARDQALSERADSRREAVKFAKSLSNRRNGRVTVRRTDGWECLIYRDGKLMESTLVTFDRRRSDRRL